MDNMIAGGVAGAIFLAFSIGLAESIGALPFWIIVLAVGGMMIFDYYESIKEHRGEE